MSTYQHQPMIQQPIKKTTHARTHAYTHPLYGPLDFVQDYPHDHHHHHQFIFHNEIARHNTHRKTTVKAGCQRSHKAQ